MKKLLIGLCAASLLGVTALTFAGGVTFENRYPYPVTFVVNNGPVYTPVVKATLYPGQRVSYFVPRTFTTDYSFMAYSPYKSNIVTNCGSPYYWVDNVVVVAGGDYGGFGCRLYQVPQKPYYGYVKHGSHKYHHHCGDVKMNQGAKQVSASQQKEVTFQSEQPVYQEKQGTTLGGVVSSVVPGGSTSQSTVTTQSTTTQGKQGYTQQNI